MDFGRKLYSISEIYSHIYKAMLIRGGSKGAISKGVLDKQFKERIMLAVTEVNSCDMCSYAHTKLALSSGMTNDEIKKLLTGDLTSAPEDELKAIMFAQHYSESRGNPDNDSWVSVVREYGRDKSIAILGSIRDIMVGNSLGIPLGSLKNRIKGNADPRSNLGYELSVVLLTVPMFIGAGIANLSYLFMKTILSD